jgi:hypothetical protein
MRRLFAIAMLLAATAHAEDDDTRVLPPERCDDLLATCKDGCSLDYGSSFTTRDKLVTCLTRCDERRELCLLRNIAKRQIVPPPATAAEKKPAPAPKVEESAPYLLPPTRYSGPEPPAAAKKPAGEEEAAPVRRNATKLDQLPSDDAEPLVKKDSRGAAPAPAKKAPTKKGDTR